MPNILIRNVPPEIHARLAAAAKERGQSLQQYALSLISAPTQGMSQAETIAWLRAWRERNPKSDDSMSGVELVSAARREHAQEIYRAMGVDWDPDDDA